MDHIYKNQLQTYALKQKLELPMYTTEREGLPHIPRFRCTVIICGQAFQTQEFFPTLKSAEQAAAKLALSSLEPQNLEGIGVAYKSLLQEIAQKQNYPFPVYATAASRVHAPTFISTVEFAGKTFRGEEATTKKVAEMSAAKVAFMSITHDNRNAPAINAMRMNYSASSSSLLQNPRNSDSLHAFSTNATKRNNVVYPSSMPMNPKELQDVRNAPASNAKEMNVSLLGLVNSTNCGTLSAPATNATKMNIAVSTSSMPQNLSVKKGSCVEEREKKLIMGTSRGRIPNDQHIVCCPWNPDMTLPQNAEMVFRDDRFISYRLMKP